MQSHPIKPVERVRSFCFGFIVALLGLLVILYQADTVWACQKETIKKHNYSKHQEIPMEEPDKRPICDSQIIATEEPSPEHVSVPDGKLLEFCQAYITEAMKNIEKLEDSEIGKVYPIMTAYMEIYGKDSTERLQALLASQNMYFVSGAAYYLGQLGDTKSIPMLKQLLTAEHIRLPPPTFNCPNHYDDIFNLPGSCPKCQAELFEAMPHIVLSARLSVAGALYLLGDPAGLEALKEILKKPYGGFVYNALALRDTKEARSILETGTRNEHEYHRAQALEALLRLGDYRYVEQSIKLLYSSNEATRYSAIDGLSKVQSSKAHEELVKFLKRNDVNLYEKLVAAVGLVAAEKKEYTKFITDACYNVNRDMDASTEFWAIGEVGGTDTLPFLESVIENNARNRLWAVVAALRILGRQNHKGNMVQ